MARPLRILHLEDDPRDTELMEAALRSDGIACEIVRVDTRDSFISELEGRQPDVIVSDISVPGFDGISAQRVWRCGTCTPEIPDEPRDGRKAGKVHQHFEKNNQAIRHQ